MAERFDSSDERSPLLPLCLDLRSRLIVVFGGGMVGERKARLFSQRAIVRVVSRDFTPGLMQMEEEGSIELIRADAIKEADVTGGCEESVKGYEDFTKTYEELIKAAFIVVPATSNRDLNLAIEEKACQMGILVNRVDGAGEVVVPSIIRKGPITVAISTESPGLTKYLRQRLEKELTENLQDMALLLKEIREELKGSVPSQKERSRIIWSILEDEEVWHLLEVSYEKAYMRAREHASSDERDSLDVDHPPQSLHRRD